MSAKMLLPVLAAASLSLAGCTHDRVANGAIIGAAGGAVVAGVVGAPLLAGAAVGAAGGAVVGAVTKHNDGYCYRHDQDGRDYRVSC